ncbi:hypothetical protein MLZ70_23670, partial [Escherichia coli]|nr:hypothetical protein [Escherichia coli]
QYTSVLPLPGSWTGTGISSAWSLPSNGVVEGHVNRLKMLKRQMHGRAGFELLRQRGMSPLA